MRSPKCLAGRDSGPVRVTVTETAIEFTCRVLDLDLATSRIAEQMTDTEFADYSRIYSE